MLLAVFGTGVLEGAMKKMSWLCRGRALGGGLLLALAALWCVPQNAGAAPITVINVPNVNLVENTPNQTVVVKINGSDAVYSEDLWVQIGDGGTTAGGVNTGPVFQNVDITNTTIFAGNNGGQGDSSYPLVWEADTYDPSGTVGDANGVLATLTISTVGMTSPSGPYQLILDNVAPNDGPFATNLYTTGDVVIPTTIDDGSITVIVPEPSAFWLVGLLGAGLLLRRLPRTQAA